jgi:hypothetical protein
MTSNRSAKISSKHALIIAMATIAMAWAGYAHAEDATRKPTGQSTASVQSTVSAQGAPSFDLRDYGDRFKLAMEAIKKESQKPDWTWARCEEDSRLAPMN